LAFAPNGLSGSLNYNKDVFSSETADFLTQEYRRLLRAFIERPDTKIWKASDAEQIKSMVQPSATDLEQQFQF
jgi:hypothetical protein